MWRLRALSDPCPMASPYDQGCQVLANLVRVPSNAGKCGYTYGTAIDDRPHLNGIRVQPALPDRAYPVYRRPELAEDGLRCLGFGYLVHIYIDVPGGTPLLLKEEKVSIRSLRYVSPVINLAVVANGCDRDVDHVALPPGDEQAYQAILEWLSRIHIQQRVVFLHVTDPKKLIAYQNILEIAEKLRIGPLISQMRGKLFSKLDYTTGDMYNVYVDDVRELYKTGCGSKNRALRKTIATSLARAWAAADLPKCKRKHIARLADEFEELWREMMESGQPGRDIIFPKTFLARHQY